MGSSSETRSSYSDISDRYAKRYYKIRNGSDKDVVKKNEKSCCERMCICCCCNGLKCLWAIIKCPFQCLHCLIVSPCLILLFCLLTLVVIGVLMYYFHKEIIDFIKVDL
ncbi:uncharacterized protein CELE_T25E12.16 [Caenorhabditis elegans]|uniref:Uncharacterized protein n=1 Tax=Caenorhabditis elegans TaxID=6239 RepID=C8JQS5_CAEEL|nr:Uncharacterized protein CELE_T25E12.16 [Caenorhabditis elegans]CBB16255.1 Uncharacterized protein CELE_T25E12.16 [Caenorhabditis elegans]|eukprot:NP_001256723.1 Uncharacterized protein CELE_T25E12.16 [Caenorhabditis elegans]